MESYNRQSSTEGVVCLSGMTSMAQNLGQLRTHSEQNVHWLHPITPVIESGSLTENPLAPLYNYRHIDSGSDTISSGSTLQLLS